MKNKTFSLFALSVFALVLLVSGVSASLTNINLVNPLTNINSSSTSFNVVFNLTSNSTTSDTTLNFGNSTLSLSGGTLVFNPNTITVGTNTITATITLPAGFSGSSILGIINVTGVTSGTSQSLPFSVEVLPPEVFASNNIAAGGLDVHKITFTNNGLDSGLTFGTTGNWFPFENLSAEVQIKNDNSNTNNDGRINNIKVQWGLWDTVKNRWVITLNDEKEFDLKTGATKTLEIPFTINNKMDVDLDQLSDGPNYKFYVIATGEADDNNATPVSHNLAKPATITLQNDFVILNNFQIPDSAQCGKTVTLTADAWSMSGNQNNVSVNVYNKDLGINQRVILGDINSFSRTPFSFDLKVPSNADEKSYPIQFLVYDDNNELYQDSSSNEAAFTLPLVVQGNCVYATATTTYVNVELSSGGSAGQPLVLTATVKNLGDKTIDYTFNVNGYSSWAQLGSLAPTNLTLAPGESQEVAITLDVNANANGDKTFNFETYSNGQLVTRQPLSATIGSGFSLGSITGGAIGSSTPLIIGLVAVIFIVLILIIVVKASKK